MLSCVTSDNINSQDSRNACFMNAFDRSDTNLIFTNVQRQYVSITNSQEMLLFSWEDKFYMLWKKCYILIIIPLLLSAVIQLRNCIIQLQNICHLLVDKNSGPQVLLFMKMTPEGNKTSFSQVGYSFTFCFPFSHYSSVVTSVNYGQEIYGIKEDKAQFTNHFLRKRTQVPIFRARLL